MRVAYADPPYLGCCGLYGHFHPDGRCWDDLSTHQLLIARLVDEFPDGWALSCSTPSLRSLLPLCPEDARIGAWTKPFAVFKPGVNPGYCWEPVLFRGGRLAAMGGGERREHSTVRDFHSESITLKRGLTGAKPSGFCGWILDLLHVQEGDEVVDLFPGTGIMGEVVGSRQGSLFTGTLP